MKAGLASVHPCVSGDADQLACFHMYTPERETNVVQEASDYCLESLTLLAKQAHKSQCIDESSDRELETYPFLKPI